MITFWKASILVGAIGLGSIVSAIASDTEVQPLPFIEKYCIACHGEEKQKGKRRFDNLSTAINDFESLELWQEIVDQLNLGEMPPEDEPNPSDRERQAMIAFTSNMLREARSKLTSSGGHTVLRRLNASEYRYTIEDLLGVKTGMWDPAADFPKDVALHGFDNNGKALVTSNLLLEEYLKSAETIIAKATNFRDAPDQQVWKSSHPFHFSKLPDDLKGVPREEVFKFDRYRPNYTSDYTKLVARHDRGGAVAFRPWAMNGAPESGTYTIRIKVASTGIVHPYPKALAKGGGNPGDLNILEIRAVDRRGSLSDSRVIIRHKLENESPEWFEWQVFLDKGYQPEIRMGNGPTAAKQLMRLVVQGEGKDLDHIKPFLEKGNGGLERWHGFFRAYRGPQIRVYAFDVTGPHLKDWPPKGQKLLFGDSSTPEEWNNQSLAKRLRVFAEAAFRRPLRDSELDDITTMVLEVKKREDVTPLQALQLGFQAVLAAPGFLYMDHAKGPLDSYALSSRLSYFLYASMPDEELLNAAASGSIDLLAQAERMLKDPKSDRFVKEFLVDWLRLNNIGEMPPADKIFRNFYRDQLGAAMQKESEIFFRDLLDRNGEITHFLDSDYTFLNEPLAKHYGIDGVSGLQFRRVSLNDRRRGGLTGQGSFLTASANGVDTSPVVRGVYLLEQILGEIPAPPPPDVPGLEPDIRGASTIRDMLIKHREVKTCAECHNTIDPPGFALENFNAIGGWRDKYGENNKGLPIDASGRFKGGSAFDGVAQFKDQLMGKQDQFARCLTEKLLTYALGREIDIHDRPEIDRILQNLKENGNGLRDLVLLIITSDLFTNN